jgi:hydroxymethylpyrimidine/phosphomethylpyrimidine kinase
MKGMLASKETINVVADAIEKYKLPLSVIDPVFQHSRHRKFKLPHD